MATNVEPAVLQQLLELQTEDLAIRRLSERRSSLPEAARLAEVTDQLNELIADIEIATKQDAELGRELSRIEGEVELIDGKIAREEQRMYSGSVSNPKELSALQAEVESLRKKKSGLEDQELEVMEQKERAAATLQSLTDEKAHAQAESDELAARVAALSGDIDAELSTHSARRHEIAPSIPPDIMSLYDRLREQKAGIGAAALEGGMCLGCHTKLPAKEVERVRAEGGLQRCDNCRRILVVV